MRDWLAAAAALTFFAATAAQAQMKGPATTRVAAIARNHELDLRLSEQRGYAHSLLLANGMLAEQDVADNAFVGVGLADMYGRKKGGLRQDDQLVRTRNPAVTFVLKF